MGPIRITLYSLIGLLVAVLVGAWFLPSQYTVTRSIVIDKPQNEVFEYVVNFHYWRRWNPWVEMEPDAEYKIEGTIRKADASWSWSGETIGNGKLTLREVVPHTLIKSDLVFTSPREGAAQDVWEFMPEGQQGTTVVWRNTGELEWPLGRLVGLVVEGQILGPAFEKGLANIKHLAENAHNLGPN